ncbi:MAG TPA: DUF417 family protein [Pirellulales bacterium]|jgi:uncharacterized membrane protein YkgB
MDRIINFLIKLKILKKDLDYHVIRASMVVIFLFFGYQKWFDYEAQALIPYIGNGPLLSWMYPVFGIRGATYFLGVSEWLFGGLLLLGFWNKKLGILGALGSCFAFVATVTIIPFMPDGWAASAGGFPAMTEKVAFLLKDLVLFAASFYLLRQGVLRVSSSRKYVHVDLISDEVTHNGPARVPLRSPINNVTTSVVPKRKAVSKPSITARKSDSTRHRVSAR